MPEIAARSFGQRAEYDKSGASPSKRFLISFSVSLRFSHSSRVKRSGRAGTARFSRRYASAFSGGRLIAALGVKGLVIAETADAVLVCPKERAQEVKKITELLEKQGRTELL